VGVPGRAGAGRTGFSGSRSCDRPGGAA